MTVVPREHLVPEPDGGETSQPSDRALSVSAFSENLIGELLVPTRIGVEKRQADEG